MDRIQIKRLPNTLLGSLVVFSDKCFCFMQGIHPKRIQTPKLRRFFGHLVAFDDTAAYCHTLFDSGIALIGNFARTCRLRPETALYV